MPDYSASSTTSPPQRTDAEQKLFDAALVVFGEKGRFGANTQEIADLAGITKASLHYYFRRKEDLYDAAFAHAIEQIATSLYGQLEPGKSFRDTLETFTHHVIGFYLEKPHILKLFLQECLNGGTIGATHMARLGWEEDSPLGVFIMNTKAAIKSGEIIKVDPFQLFLTSLASCVFPIVSEPIFGRIVPVMKRDASKFLAARKKHVFETIYRGVATEVVP